MWSPRATISIPKEQLGEYGYGEIPDVIDGLAFERMLRPEWSDPRENPFGPPTERCPRRWSSSSVWPPGTRTDTCPTARGFAACTRPNMQPFIKSRFRTDSPMSSTWTFVRTAKDMRSSSRRRSRRRGSSISGAGSPGSFRRTGRVRVLGVDTLTGRVVEVAADMVVLATAIVPSQGVKDLAAKLRATVDRHGFLTEAHIKLYPVESSTKGIYLAGCGQGPKDISDTVSQASADGKQNSGAAFHGSSFCRIR